MLTIGRTDSTTGDTAGARPVWLPTQRKDVAMALVVVIIAIASAITEPPKPLPIAVLGGVVALVPSVAVLWRDRLETRLLVLAIAASLTAAILGTTDPFLPSLIALATISLRRGTRYTAIAFGVLIVQIALTEVIRAGFHGDAAAGVANIALAVGVLALIPAAGQYAGARRVYVQSLIDRNAALEREREALERERELLAREAIAVERTRIARELHDVVAHHVSVMVIQTGAAEATLPPGSEATSLALTTIRETGREALSEMRRMLSVLRESGDAGRNEGADAEGRSPQPGVDQLPILVARMRESGVDASLEYAGPSRRLPPGIDLSVYRIAQEALTNTLRHAGRGATAKLRLTFEPDSLTLDCSDDGIGEPQMPTLERAGRASGHGLVGMRERVAVYGGTLVAGRQPGGGFRVTARFPLEPLNQAATAPAASLAPAAAVAQEERT